MSHGQTALDARAAEPTPGAARRIVLVVGWLCAVALAVLVLHLLGVDVEGWFSSLWDALTAVDPEDVLAGLGLQTIDTFLSGIAWLAILRAAYPRAGIEALPIITAYAVAVAGNDVLPANLGTFVMLVMLAAIIPGATFPGLVGGQVVHKLFFVAAGAFVYLYLFLSVPGSFSLQLGLVADHVVLAIVLVVAVVAGLVLVARVFWGQGARAVGAREAGWRDPPGHACVRAQGRAPRIRRVDLQARRDRRLPGRVRDPGDVPHDHERGRWKLAGERRLGDAGRRRSEPGGQLCGPDPRGRRPRDGARILHRPAVDHDRVERHPRGRPRRGDVRLDRRQAAHRQSYGEARARASHHGDALDSGDGVPS